MPKTLILLTSLILVTPPLMAQPYEDKVGFVVPGAPSAVTDADFFDGGQPDPAKVELGQLLFFDKILSGNLNTSCATCHHPLAGTGDWLSLPVGEGGEGLATARTTGSGADAVHERVPRNAPAVWNLGALEFTVMFHDGRVTVDPEQPSGFVSPAGDDLPLGLDNALAVQAMFPVTSGAEMAGQAGENPVADASAAGDLPALWNLLAERLRGIDGYVTRFVAVFDDIESAADITYAHAANAIAAFEAAVWRADDSPFDRLLRGDKRAMTRAQKNGMWLFYGPAGCAGCHSGKFQTDHQFHAIAMPQLGPGKGDGTGYEDFGRGRETGDPADNFRFRTPSLRNVAINGPWSHSGAYGSLRAVVEHHLDPVGSLRSWDRSQVSLPQREDLDQLDYKCMEDPYALQAIADANELWPIELRPQEIDDLIDFLHALTDPAVFDLRLDVPASVPSGLPVYD